MSYTCKRCGQVLGGHNKTLHPTPCKPGPPLTTCQCNPRPHWCDPVREAAPALLEALEEQVRGAEWRRENEPEQWNGADDEALERASAAIRRARGERC